MSCFTRLINSFFFIVIALLFLNNTTSAKPPSSADSSNEDTTPAVIDADFKLEEALEGTNIPAYIKDDLVLVNVQYYGFEGLLHQGQLVVNNKISNDIKDIFQFIKKIKFPIEKVIPISEYNWSDDESMKENNTSAFNYRFISGTKILSMHAEGLAIDINPRQNPYIKNGTCSPAGSVYDVTKKGTITSGSKIVEKFKERGWEWGGDWKNLKDYQHFQKDIR